MTKITFEELAKVLTAIYKYQQTKNIVDIENIQDLIKTARDVDYGIKTYSELDSKENFIESSHGPARMAMFLLNYFGEQFLNEALITIEADDPKVKLNSHINTYQLILKNMNEHEYLEPGNPTKEDNPYDLDTVFVKQITVYPDNVTNTTATSYDSFHGGYMKPYRTLDFKSAFWSTGKHTHDVNYIIQIDHSGDIKLLLNKVFTEKQFKIAPKDQNKRFYTRYCRLLKVFSTFEPLTWDQFIINK